MQSQQQRITLFVKKKKNGQTISKTYMTYCFSLGEMHGGEMTEVK